MTKKNYVIANEVQQLPHAAPWSCHVSTTLKQQA